MHLPLLPVSPFSIFLHCPRVWDAATDPERLVTPDSQLVGGS